jgi:hypothetical protein
MEEIRKIEKDSNRVLAELKEA